MKNRPRNLTPSEARNSLANRLARVADRGRAIDARLGNRPYQVFLCWTRWSGDERGEGLEEVVCRIPIVPTPVVADLTSIALSPFGAGVLPVGSVRVTEVSVTYSLETLMGRVVPNRREDQVPHPYDFFYEVVEDGRHQACDGPPARPRFRLLSSPFLDAPKQQWVLVLERQSGDMGKDGKPTNAPVPVSKDPWEQRGIEPPPDED